MTTVIPIVLVSSLLVGLTWASSARISETLGREVMAGAASHVAAEVRSYLGDAIRLSDRYARSLDAGVLPDPPGLGWERTMLDDLVATPNVASICYGNSSGDATWLSREPGRLRIGRTQGATENGTVEFEVDSATGATIGEPLRIYTYDPRKRPWWSAAVACEGPCWTPIYPWYAGNSSEGMVGAGYVRRIINRDGSMRGVLIVDVTLGALSTFLRTLEISERGRIFIVDGDARLVAASYGRVTDERGQRNAPTFQRVRASSDRTILDGSPARIQSAELRPYPGIAWKVTTVLPESAFLSEAQAVRRRALFAGSGVVLASLLLGLALTRFLSRPVLVMTRHVKNVGVGDFDTRLHLNAARELAVLSEEINAMAGGLKERMTLEQSMAVARQVQNSLLPEPDPFHPTLDVAGRSRYCEATGGDYFDFIDVSQRSECALLIAVGDVVGHGIAAALLMATARGALRANLLDQSTLGEVLTCVNRILATNNPNNRFMTLSLLRIDGRTGAIRWASAGHDPAIIYDPLADRFRELTEGDVPLGIMKDVEYEEHAGEALRTNDVLVVATDGVWEALNEREEQYGKDRLRAVVRAHCAAPAFEIARALEADLATFRGAQKCVDDVTFVIVRTAMRTAGSSDGAESSEAPGSSARRGCIGAGRQHTAAH